MNTNEEGIKPFDEKGGEEAHISDNESPLIRHPSTTSNSTRTSYGAAVIARTHSSSRGQETDTNTTSFSSPSSLNIAASWKKFSVCLSLLLIISAVAIIFLVSNSDNDGSSLDAPLFKGLPFCGNLGLSFQPLYQDFGIPTGGRNCPCNANKPGYFYAWSAVNDNTISKIGCTSRTCEVRIKEEIEINSGFNFQRDIRYICATINSGEKYERQLTNCNSIIPDGDYSFCNAGEVFLQDFYYCKGVWAGRDGIGKPLIANNNGKGEWFRVSLAEIESYMRFRGFNIVFPTSQNTPEDNAEVLLMPDNNNSL